MRENRIKKTGNMKGFRSFISVLAAMVLTASIQITALADAAFEGDITVTNVVAGYEYKIYEVLDVARLGSEGTFFEATERWKDFIHTDKNAVELLVSNGDGTYTVNKDADKDVKHGFAENVLQYAEENGIEATESRTAEEGDREVSFSSLMLGIYVIDTAGKARITVMWDMEWQSEIKESYKPEAETADTSTGTEEKPEIQEESESIAEEANTDENVTTDAGNMETESAEESVELLLSVEEEASKESSIFPVIIVAAVAVVAAAAGILFIKKKK